MTLTEAVDDALEAVPVLGQDVGAVQLARHYAAAIEAGGELEKLGPALLTVLESLGMTPRARKSVQGGAPDARSPLDELRDRRSKRA